MNGFEETVVIIFGIGVLGSLWIEGIYVSFLKKFLDTLHLHLLAVSNSKTLEKITERDQKKE